MKTQRMKPEPRTTRQRAAGTARLRIPWPAAASLVALAWLAPGCGDLDPVGQARSSLGMPWNGGAMKCNTLYTLAGDVQTESCANAIQKADDALATARAAAHNACWKASGWKGTLYGDLPRAMPASGMCDEESELVYHDKDSPPLELIFFGHRMEQDVFCRCPTPADPAPQVPFHVETCGDRIDIEQSWGYPAPGTGPVVALDVIKTATAYRDQIVALAEAACANACSDGAEMVWELTEIDSGPVGVTVTIRGTCRGSLQDKAAETSKTTKVPKSAPDEDAVDGCPGEQTADTAD